MYNKFLIIHFFSKNDIKVLFSNVKKADLSLLNEKFIHETILFNIFSSKPNKRR